MLGSGWHSTTIQIDVKKTWDDRTSLHVSKRLLAANVVEMRADSLQPGCIEKAEQRSSKTVAFKLVKTRSSDKSCSQVEFCDASSIEKWDQDQTQVQSWRLTLFEKWMARVWGYRLLQMLSLSIDFYVRVFVRVYTSAIQVKDAATKLMYVYQSTGCDSFFTQAVGRKVTALAQSQLRVLLWPLDLILATVCKRYFLICKTSINLFLL